jgi:hypothetical protein
MRSHVPMSSPMKWERRGPAAKRWEGEGNEVEVWPHEWDNRDNKTVVGGVGKN